MQNEYLNNRATLANAYDVTQIADVSRDVRIATLRSVHSGKIHYAIQATESGCVYFRTNIADKAVRLGLRLAATFKAARKAGGKQTGDGTRAYQAFIADTPPVSMLASIGNPFSDMPYWARD